jgi:deoxycytidine triphosphate deaminase
MSLLSGPEIEARIKAGEITIDPFDPDAVGPNSVDLTLADVLRVYDPRGAVLDAKADNPTRLVPIPAGGIILTPGTLYLGATVERTACPGLVPCVETRSSYARLGLSAHLSAGFGDHGADLRWTLEITVVHPLRVYAGAKLVQVFFQELVGARRPYAGRYQHSAGPVASRSWKS